MKRVASLLAVLIATTLAGPPLAAAADETLATAGAGGVYPAGTAFTGIDVTGVQLGFGAEVHAGGTGLGNFTAVLLGVSGAGTEQRIVIDGEVIGGSRTAENVAVLTGRGTLDLGDGTLPTPDVPFTATLTSGANGLGTVGLDIAYTELPAATLNAGSLTIQ